MNEQKIMDELFNDLYDALCGAMYKQAQNDATVTAIMVQTAFERAWEKYFFIKPDAE